MIIYTIMAKFKLKMNQNEMRVLGSCCIYTVRMCGKVDSISRIAVLETCERLWSRMRNMYRPDRDKYTITLSAMEVITLTGSVLPRMQDSEEPLLRTVGFTFGEELRKQCEREINIYNAMR